VRITRIFIAGYRRDLNFTRCCVASIRRWYPRISITLIKDEIAGRYDTSDLENHFAVEIFQTPVKQFGWGMSKLEPLFLPGHERCLILDSDVLFMGRVLDKLQRYSEDFIVVHETHPVEEIRRHYLDDEALPSLYPTFRFPGYVFNTGQIVATTGIFRREDFADLVSFSEPREPLQPTAFFCGEQGLLNYLVLSKVQAGSITLKRAHFMKWAGGMKPEEVRLTKLGSRSPYDFMIHWAGPKAESLAMAPMAHLLEHFEKEYQQRLHPSRPRSSFREIRDVALGAWRRLARRSS
jgi:hypothetical protein